MPGETLGPVEEEVKEERYGAFRDNARRFKEEHIQLGVQLQDVLLKIERESDPRKLVELRQEWQKIARASEDALSKEKDWLDSAEFLNEEAKRLETQR